MAIKTEKQLVDEIKAIDVQIQSKVTSIETNTVNITKATMEMNELIEDKKDKLTELGIDTYNLVR